VYYIGKVSSIKDSILYCLNNPGSNTSPFVGELLYIPNSANSTMVRGVVFESTYSFLKILLLDNKQDEMNIGDKVYGSYRSIRIKVGFSILSKVMNPFGDVLSSQESGNEMTFLFDNLFETEYRDLSNSYPSIIERKKVSKPLLTGINSIDCLFPIGLGQRQLIIGDNNTGKTSLAVSAILNQKNFNVFSKVRYYKYSKLNYFKPCVYVSIGQKRSEAIRIKEVLSNLNSF